MQQSNAPSKISLPFAASGGKNTIPVNSNPTPGGASFADGFPPLTRTPKVSGGIPPSGLDMNGVLYSLSAINKWSSAGAGYAYDSTFANDPNVNGYPKGATVLTSDGLGAWKSTVDNNVVDPESANTGWIPAAQWGVQAVTVSNANITLTPLQANKYTIALSGTLSANINIVLPSWAGVEWLVIGGFSGAFTVTCKTASGTGVAISSGNNVTIYCDGTNIVNANISAAVSTAGVSGARKNLKISYTGTSSAVTVTADELTVGNGSGGYITLRNLNLSANSGSASGSANSLDTGAWAYNTFYYVYVIYNGTTSALLFSLSSSSPSLPSGYTYFARIGANITQSATNYWFLRGQQSNDLFAYWVAAGSNVTTLRIVSSGVQGSVTTPTWVSTSITSHVPPTASGVNIAVSLGVTGCAMVAANNSFGAYTSTTNPAPFSTAFATGSNGTFQGFIPIETTGTIYWASNLAGNNLIVLGWKDNI